MAKGEGMRTPKVAELKVVDYMWLIQILKFSVQFGRAHAAHGLMHW